MTIWERITTALAAIGIPIAAETDRNILGDPLPDDFLVYSLVSAVADTFADNAETERFYRVQLSIYSRSGLHALVDTDTPMLAQGFIFSNERALPFNPPSGHYGLVRQYTILLDRS